MDPNFIAYLTQHRHDDGMEREYVVYRPAADRAWPRLSLKARRGLAAMFITIGERLNAGTPGSVGEPTDTTGVARTGH